ncbi:MAG: chorismate mutase [Cyanobacteriota bacterium]|jgi:chorismate mutase
MATPALELRALRGATTAAANTCEAIDDAVSELIDALVQANNLEGSRLLSVTFSVTTDLDACFPAAIARRCAGWGEVALLDCQQMAVDGDLPRCIRLLAHAWLEAGSAPVHPYLREASRLRPDRAVSPPATSPADH